MVTANTADRLAALRRLMGREKVDVYVIPSEDSHSSEYICEADARRAWLTGFTGSAGCAVVTHEKAVLATDGRYFNQAEHQLDSNWELLKQGMPDVPTWQEWAAQHSEGGKTVGVDATLITAQQAKSLETRIKKKGGAGLLGMSKNLVDEIWTDRPARPNNPVMVLNIEYAGQPFQEKIEAVRKGLEKKKSPGFVVSMLDEIAWLYNLRGSDIPYNPVFFAYAFITPTSATLYIDSKKLPEAALEHLGDEVKIKPYEAVFTDLTTVSTKLRDGALVSGDAMAKKWLLSNKASWALSKALGGDEYVEVVRSPIEEAKAVKNETERSGMRNCHIRDGVALIKYFSWLEEELKKGTELDEVQAADKLEEFRKVGEHFKGLSFDTISSTGPNAAVIHYKPEPGSCSKIDPKAVYLCDSGAQYLDGTTDTTRTLHFGEPTEMEKKAYTLVLKGMVALDRVVFPKGTSGFALDVLARQFLWSEGLDYRHGTGHGVGSFLNVHEGPIGIGTRLQYSEVPLAPGMVISDEPGYYEDGNFGIRIENVIMVKEAKTNHQFGDKPYYGFEHVTMVPMCKKLTDENLLTPAEKKWLNDYHAEVLEKAKAKGFLEKDSAAMKWLERETAPIPI
ncbi:putative Xaa-Pro aminopeptidase P [Sphaerosporella brunnea]|uniref:Probable Xaa-Pro aminopeptidase P n=1 Tax=Sphaerosporella brunnea TaxID=1250544 RepID=A0A5J5EFF6_9PEZI|nr:putative Xaa-Pro aminopeptidase P [Sphaerosporella brunnea]